ncbi:hypothetical protein ACFQ3L_06925 [Lacticaseibacillus jixianensis]|uniref:Uncharacterized protein n=1 Tax=Lacticaseibacillus jixianensis TaxID=2486012 RepID=A0ABW4B974_9LACO|nr:hypothetical protein [Lacticaseibacillus jixianensis]
MRTLTYTMTIRKAIAIETALRRLSDRFAVVFYPAYKNRRGVSYMAQIMVSYRSEGKEVIVWDSLQMGLQSPYFRDARKGPLNVPKALLNAALKTIETLSQSYSAERYQTLAADEPNPLAVAVNERTIPALLKRVEEKQAELAKRRKSVALEDVVSLTALRGYCATRLAEEDDWHGGRIVLPVIELSLRPGCPDERQVMLSGYEAVMARAVTPMNAEWQGAIPLLPGEPMLSLTNSLGFDAVLSHNGGRRCDVLRLGTTADVWRAFDGLQQLERRFEPLGDGSLL